MLTVGVDSCCWEAGACGNRVMWEQGNFQYVLGVVCVGVGAGVCVGVGAA